MSNLVGKIILDRYRIDSFLGRGGMAEVYKAWDLRRNAWVAMKILHEDLALDHIFLRRFKREADTLAKLQHPNIVRFYGLEQDGRLTFMLMDFVEGESLKHKIFDERGKIPFEEVYEIIKQIAWALKYAHEEGFVHSDVKPANILIDKAGQVKLSDFGIARMAEATTMTMVGAGTPAYMAPEQIKGEPPSFQTDIYALGIVLYEMLTGERPFTGELATISGTSSEKIRWEQTKLNPIAPSRWKPLLSSELDSIILKMLEKDNKERFQNIGLLLEALSKAFSTKLETEIEDTPKEQIDATSKKLAYNPVEIKTNTPKFEASETAEQSPTRHPDQVTAEETKNILKAYWLHLFLGVGLFYLKSKSFRRWIYPITLLLILWEFFNQFWEVYSNRGLTEYRFATILLAGIAIILHIIGFFDVKKAFNDNFHQQFSSLDHNSAKKISWKNILLSTLGLTIFIKVSLDIGYGISLLGYSLSSFYILNAIGFAISGATLGTFMTFVMLYEIYPLTTKETIWIIIGWALGWAIGFYTTYFIRGFEYHINLGHSLGWSIGGAITSFVLQKNINFKASFGLTIIWIISSNIGLMINSLFFHNSFPYYCGFDCLPPIGFAIGGSIGALMTTIILQRNKAKELTST